MADPTDDQVEQLELVTTVDRTLPTFEGKVPVAVQTRLTGTSQRIARALHHDDRVVILGLAEVVDVRHPKQKDGIVRLQMLAVTDLFEVEGVVGQRLLATARQAWAGANPAAGTVLGEVPLDAEADGPVFPVDASGVALTPAELAAIGLGNSDLDTVVVVWSDGTRDTWPDDYDAAAYPGRPVAGEYRDPFVPGEPAPPYVAEVLDARTSEQLDVWTEEQENDRLREAEAAQAALEAAGEPVPGYSDLNATAALKAVNAAEAEQLEALRSYEQAHKARKSVLARIAARILAEQPEED